jgi:hypothetical protein
MPGNGKRIGIRRNCWCWLGSLGTGPGRSARELRADFRYRRGKNQLGWWKRPKPIGTGENKPLPARSEFSGVVFSGPKHASRSLRKTQRPETWGVSSIGSSIGYRYRLTGGRFCPRIQEFDETARWRRKGAAGLQPWFRKPGRHRRPMKPGRTKNLKGKLRCRPGSADGIGIWLNRKIERTSELIQIQGLRQNSARVFWYRSGGWRNLPAGTWPESGRRQTWQPFRARSP